MSKSKSELGATLITFAFTLMVLVAALALAVDLGLGYVERRVVQAVADSAALAGVELMTDNGTDTQILAAITDYVQVKNPLGRYESGRTSTAQWLSGTTLVGTVGSGTRPSTATGILVTVTGNVPTIFAHMWGINVVHTVGTGGGGHSPLDVVLVLDRSGSMDDDSCYLKTITSGFSLRSYAKDQCIGVMSGDGLSSDDCGNCGGRWHTGYPTWCGWPDNSKMGSEVTATCGSVHSSQSTCLACKGLWKTPSQPIDNLRAAAQGFVDLATQLAPTSPHIAVVSYSDHATLNSQLTGNFTSVKTAISGVNASGYTNCEDGMYQAKAELTTSSRQRWNAAKVIIFMSDGNANRCRGTSGTCSQGKQKAIDLAQQAGAAGIVVYSIGLGSDADQDMLQRMVTGEGVFLYAPSGAQLDSVYQQMFQKIKRLRLVM